MTTNANIMTPKESIIKLDTVDDYNRIFGLETLHPLVTVVDLSEATKYPTHFTVNYGLYALYLKETKCGDILRPKAKGILFHPDIIKGTSLGQEIKSYSFFSYNSTEALHLSEDEKTIFADCLDKIKMELNHPIDKLSKRLIARNIQLLLDYCMRFYERQFVTRKASNRDILYKFESLLDAYFQDNKPQTEGLPSVRYFAERVFLSPNYFGDLIKKETGKTAQEYIQNKLIDNAKQMIAGSDKTISQIAYELGFQYSQHFNRVFKKNVGCTPNEYRSQMSAN